MFRVLYRDRKNTIRDESSSLFKKTRARNTRDNIRFRRAKKSPDRRRLSTAYCVPLCTLCPERRFRRFRRFCRYRLLITALDTFILSKRLGSCRVLRLRVVVPWSLDNARARERNAREERYERALSKRIQNALWCTRFEWNNRVDHERKRLSYFFLGICSLRCWSHFISSARTCRRRRRRKSQQQQPRG